MDGVRTTDLHIAALSGIVEFVRTLIDVGAQINAHDADERTPLHLAARGGSGEVVQALLGGGAEVGDVNNDGRTPLHVAARGGSGEVIQALLDGGADIGAMDTGGMNPLCHAVIGRHFESAKSLVKACSCIAVGSFFEGAHMCDRLCRKPLHLAVLTGQQDMVGLLLEPCSEGAFLCRHCCGMLLSLATVLGYAQMITRLASAPTNGDSSTGASWQPDASSLVNIAAKHGHVHLIDHPHLTNDWNSEDWHKDRPLHVAARHGRLEMVEKLLELQGIAKDIDAKNMDGHTPLSSALCPWREAQAGNEGLPDSLRSADAAADVDQEDQNHKSIVLFLLKSGADLRYLNGRDARHCLRIVFSDGATDPRLAARLLLKWCIPRCWESTRGDGTSRRCRVLRRCSLSPDVSGVLPTHWSSSGGGGPCWPFRRSTAADARHGRSRGLGSRGGSSDGSSGR